MHPPAGSPGTAPFQRPQGVGTCLVEPFHGVGGKGYVGDIQEFAATLLAEEMLYGIDVGAAAVLAVHAAPEVV